MRRKLRSLTVYLLKENVNDYEQALRAPTTYQRVELRGGIPFNGTVFVKSSYSGAPSWVSYVETGTLDRLGITAGVTGSAVLFLEASDRRFAFAFGYGSGMLAANSFERDFGLRATLNAVDPERLRAIDVHTVEELTLHTTTQASRAATLDTFGVDVTRDLLRSVTGEPRNQDAARRMGGSDGLRFDAYVEFDQLGSKCDELFTLYSAHDYKRAFAWVDHLRPVGDPGLIEVLDASLLAALAGDRVHQPHLAPPEPVDWMSIEGFTFSTPERSMEPGELDLDTYLLSRMSLDTISISDLKQDRVEERRTDSGMNVERWPIYDCLVFETQLSQDLFVLTRGRWFRVDQDFANSVSTVVREIPQVDLGLPPARRGEWERDYNGRAAAACSFALLDRQSLRPEGASAGIEFCDLLAPSGHLIHVKKWSQSATLSHLFAQGTVSAETLLRDASFRKKLRSRLRKTHPEMGDLIPLRIVDRTQFPIVYAILGKERATDLPFFSQLAMSQAAGRLRDLGFSALTSFVQVRD